jgi:arsenite methyltransferase
MKILVLCTGNSCRSQMADGFLKSFDKNIQCVSAGTNPALEVHAKAIAVMKEIGVDISDNKPKPVDDFLQEEFDYVITVCDDANETCPTFVGKVKNRLHIGFNDPAKVKGTEEHILSEFRRIRDEIKSKLSELYNDIKFQLSNELKNMVKEKYSEIVKQSSCGCCCDGKADFTIMKDDYSDIEGYVSDADLGLGCGLPTQFANINEGDTVLDLGSGAGNDVFIARRIVGDKGYVIGLDMTEDMLEKANINKQKLGYENIDFRLGEIENIPVDSDSVDVVISNCVLNLVPDKQKAFSEIFRVLKPGGHLCVSDIVLVGDLPDNLRNAAAMYAGCVSGALQKEEYLDLLRNKDFKSIDIKAEKNIKIPFSILLNYLYPNEIEEFKQKGDIIKSITVYADK